MTQRKSTKTVKITPVLPSESVSGQSNTTVTPKAKTSQKASQKVTATKPTIASLSSEVDSLKARLENSKKYAEELEGKLIFASSKIKNLELDLQDLEDESFWEYTKRKVYTFFTFGF